VSEVQPNADGTISLLFQGQPLRLRPAFTVGLTSAGAQPVIVRESGDTFTFTSAGGRRQRFMIVP
jgi:ornithine carbamoyltransferase